MITEHDSDQIPDIPPVKNGKDSSQRYLFLKTALHHITVPSDYSHVLDKKADRGG